MSPPPGVSGRRLEAGASGCRFEAGGGEHRGTLKTRRKRSGQTAQKRDDFSHFIVRKRGSQLHPAHDADGLGKRGNRPVVEVWRSHGRVAKARNLEDIQVRFVLGDVEPPLVDLVAASRLPLVLDNPKLAKFRPANQCVMMALRTANFEES